MTATTRGFSLLEVVFALALLSVVSTGLAAAVAQSLRARAVARDLMQATQLAADAFELVRAGAVPEVSGASPDARFQRRVSLAAFAPSLHLQRVDVVVAWNDGQPRQVALSSLLPE